jgi:hypothetical protein
MALELGLLCADPVYLERALALAHGVADVQLFLMDDAVRVADHPLLAAAMSDGLEATLCATDAEARAVPPQCGGPRFGSQWDHAIMVRDAARVVAMTGERVSDARPVCGGADRRVAVRLARAADHPKTAQGLRTAVGYAACRLPVTVVVEPPAHSLLAPVPHPPSVARALATLHALARFIPVAGGDDPVACDVEVTW